MVLDILRESHGFGHMGWWRDHRLGLGKNFLQNSLSTLGMDANANANANAKANRIASRGSMAPCLAGGAYDIPIEQWHEL
jgi:hypothetical protein